MTLLRRQAFKLEFSQNSNRSPFFKVGFAQLIQKDMCPHPNQPQYDLAGILDFLVIHLSFMHGIKNKKKDSFNRQASKKEHYLVLQEIFQLNWLVCYIYIELVSKGPSYRWNYQLAKI